ncbi:hypothetical protein Glove_290g103 [Diversispora epigaea]|uniref:Uncharacterized protein n=1 Tax=Diversispora epigaea TaxID=1348612 RepID=A0A397I7D5_9GLOM|nr:hypothetical protein Glove_290g103 [Diversispora epigaea]
MVRKRSLASVLYEDDTSSDRNRNSRNYTYSRNRSISNILGEELTSNQPSSSSRLILCNCPKCNGRLIDPYTKVIYDLSNESLEISIESFQNRQEIEESERIGESSSSKSTTLMQDVNLLEIEKDDIPNLTFLPKIRPKRHTNQPISVEISNIITDDEVLNISSEDEMEEMEEISIESEEESADEFSNIFEDYLSPNYDPDEPIDPKSTNNNSYLWILLWIMSFRIKFNLPETATESLIKFIKLLLSEISNSEFDTFPNSIYMTKKELGLRDNFYSFPTYPYTKVIYDLSNESLEISIESFQNRQEIEESERIGESSSSKSTTLMQDVNLLEIEKDDIPNLTFLPKIRPKRHTNQPISVEISNIITDDEVLNISSEDEMEEMEEISIESEEESADEFSNIFEDYLSPNYDPDEPIDPKSTNNNSYLWILLWIMSFRIKFNLPETATESLIKFIKLLLSEISNSEFDTFPNSIYMTKKELGLRDNFYSFPTCPKCHKLYNKQEVEDYKENDTNSIMKCRHVEFPNSATRQNRNNG